MDNETPWESFLNSGTPAILERFKEGLKEIQKDHQEWFESEQNTLGNLSEHCDLYANQETYFFKFKPDSSLPGLLREKIEFFVSGLLSK